MTILARDEITLSKIVKKADITEAVDGVQVGGRNYYRPTKTIDLGVAATMEPSLISTGSCVGFYVPTAAGEEWSISRSALTNNRFDYMFTIDEPASGVLVKDWTNAFRSELKIEGIVVPEGYNYLFFYLSNQNDSMPNVKLEKGNKATDWTPAPEDQEAYTDAAAGEVQASVDNVETRVTTSESAIEDIRESISNIVRGSDGSSLVRQDENGLFYFDVEPLQNSADESARKLAEILDALGDIDSSDEETLLGKLDKLEEELLALGIKTEYIGKSTYTADDGNEEPCLVLGETDSDFKLLITNKRFLFMEGSTETTYIKDNMLVTNNIEVKEDFKQGDWVWKTRPNGNLGLVWIGGAE